jgi:hypothetical protein
MMTDSEWAAFYETMMSTEDMLETWATYCVATPVYPEEWEKVI